MIFSKLENTGIEKRNSQKVVSSLFSSLNCSKTDFSSSGVSDVLMEFFPTSEGYVKATPMSPNPADPQYSYNYVYNYTDHLGNVRISYAKDPQTGDLKVMEENNYYPYGLKHAGYASAVSLSFQKQLDDWGVILAPVTNNPYKYKYNGKELQDELGLNWYDYQARNYDPALGRWFNLDPLAETNRRNSPYVYALNNPVFFIDPDGMEGEASSDSSSSETGAGTDDVILGGTMKQQTFTELQKGTQGQVNLSMDQNGKLSYETIEGATISQDTQQLMNAIDAHSVNVNVTTTNDRSIAIAGDAYNGNKITSGLSIDSSLQGSPYKSVEAEQTLNPEITKTADDFYGKPGANAMLAVTEAYQGALLSQASGIPAGPAIRGADGNVSEPTYLPAHNLATPQSGPIGVGFVNSQGQIVPTANGADHISLYVQKEGKGGTEAQEINALPIK